MAPNDFHRVSLLPNRYPKTLKMLGMVPDELGFSSSLTGGASTEETLRPYLDALRDFRHEVRTTMRAGGDKGAVLGACDNVRDEVLPSLGVWLEDLSDPPSSRWKLEDPKVLLKEIEEKKQAEAEAKAAKKGKEIEKARKKLAGEWRVVVYESRAQMWQCRQMARRVRGSKVPRGRM